MVARWQTKNLQKTRPKSQTVGINGGMLLVNLSQQTAKLEEDFAALKELAGMMVATLQINFLRGTLTTNPESSKGELKNLLDSWSAQYNSIIPTVTLRDDEDFLVTKSENWTTVINKKIIEGLEF